MTANDPLREAVETIMLIDDKLNDCREWGLSIADCDEVIFMIEECLAIPEVNAVYEALKSDGTQIALLDDDDDVPTEADLLASLEFRKKRSQVLDDEAYAQEATEIDSIIAALEGAK